MRVIRVGGGWKTSTLSDLVRMYLQWSREPLPPGFLEKCCLPSKNHSLQADFPVLIARCSSGLLPVCRQFGSQDGAEHSLLSFRQWNLRADLESELC
jgi:hypothetical protein